MFMRKKMLIQKFRLVVLIVILFSICTQAFAERQDFSKEDFSEMSIEELVNIEDATVSKKERTLFKTFAATTILTQEDSQRLGHQSTPELLRIVPGVNVAKTDSNKWAITTRGFNSMYAEKSLVLIDGRTVYTPLYSGAYWDVQDAMLEDVERIEVIQDPGGTLWATNAVVWLTWHVSKNMDISLVGQNLLSRAHTEFWDYSVTAIEMQRAVFVKATWRF